MSFLSWLRGEARDRWYRLGLEVNPAWIDALPPVDGLSPQRAAESAVAHELAVLGFRTRVVYQDPTLEHVWNAIVLRTGPSAGASTDRVRVTSSVLVDAPYDPEPANDPTLDVGMNADEARAVRIAMLKENDPKKLAGFAETLAEDFPIAHALIADKSRRLREARTLRVSGRNWSEEAKRVPVRGAYLAHQPLPAALGEDYRKALADIAHEEPIASSSTHVREAVFASLSQDGRTLDPEAVRHFLANAPAPEPPSNAAMHLAFANLRPKTSGVSQPSKIKARTMAVKAAADAGDPQAIRAAAQMTRATRAIERQNAVMWYLRAERSGVL